MTKKTITESLIKRRKRRKTGFQMQKRGFFNEPLKLEYKRM
jgi:hypothetical protein